jgi:hydrogenase nickel incorporation protein HypB
MKMDVTLLKKTILENNDADADALRRENAAKGLCYVNLMASPGSGKTATILALYRALKERFAIGVMEADIDSDVDARTLVEAGVPAVQLHTGGMCHLDAAMSRQGLAALKAENYDLVILENVGNLVCPAEFDTGAALNLVILSVPEGDDKPLKYPLVFEQCDAVIINKMDALPAFDFDLEKCRGHLQKRRPGVPVFPISAVTGDGVGALADWLSETIQEKMKKEAGDGQH